MLAGDRIACLEKQVATLMRLHKRHMQSRKEEVADMLMHAGNRELQQQLEQQQLQLRRGQQTGLTRMEMEKYLDELCDDLEMVPKDFLRWLLEHPLQNQSLQPLHPCPARVFLDELDRAVLARPNMFYDGHHSEKPRGNWFETRFKPKEPWFVSWLQAQRASGRIMRKSAGHAGGHSSSQSDQRDLGLYSELHELNLVGEVRFYFRHMKASPP